MHGSEPPSDWIRRWSHLLPARSSVLDVACGRGRHVRWLHGLGHAVTGVDRSAEALEELAPLTSPASGAGSPAGAPAVETVCADIESGPWPFTGREFGAVVVTHYLWRPLLPTLVASVAPGGVLLYETFAAGNETVGRPSRPDFLLAPGELLAVCQGLRIVAFEDGWLPAPERFVQRIAAVRELPGSVPARHALAPAAAASTPAPGVRVASNHP